MEEDAMGKSFRWILTAAIVIATAAAVLILVSYMRRMSVRAGEKSTQTVPSAEEVAQHRGAMSSVRQEELEA
jgi:uncharacterized membrane protein